MHEHETPQIGAIIERLYNELSGLMVFGVKCAVSTVARIRGDSVQSMALAQTGKRSPSTFLSGTMKPKLYRARVIATYILF